MDDRKVALSVGEPVAVPAERPAVVDGLPAGSGELFAAQQRLTLAVEDAWAGGGVVPCLVEPEPLWLSESPADRQRAVELCGGCPVIDSCRALAEAQPQVYGVWGGRSYSGGAQARALPDAEAERVGELVTAARGRPRSTPQGQARDAYLRRLFQAGWSVPAIAGAAGMTPGTVRQIVAAKADSAETVARARRRVA